MTDIVAPVTPPAPPANAAEAKTVLQSRLTDKEWGAKLLANDVATNTEYRNLRALADNPDPADQVAVAMSGADLGPMPDSSVKLMAETAGMLREIGIREEIIEQTLRGHEVTAHEAQLVNAYKARLLKDPTFVKAYLEGNADARQKMTLIAIVQSGSVKGARGSF